MKEQNCEKDLKEKLENTPFPAATDKGPPQDTIREWIAIAEKRRAQRTKKRKLIALAVIICGVIGAIFIIRPF